MKQPAGLLATVVWFMQQNLLDIFVSVLLVAGTNWIFCFPDKDDIQKSIAFVCDKGLDWQASGNGWKDLLELDGTSRWESAWIWMECLIEAFNAPPRAWQNFGVIHLEYSCMCARNFCTHTQNFLWSNPCEKLGFFDSLMFKWPSTTWCYAPLVAIPVPSICNVELVVV